MLPSADVTRMRQVQVEAMPQTCTRSRPTWTDDGGGGRLPGAPVEITLACRVSSHGVPTEYQRAEALAGRELRVVTLPHGSDVVRTDQLIVGGQTLEIVGGIAAGEWATVVRLVCAVLS
jgi:hypothetical protein